MATPETVAFQQDALTFMQKRSLCPPNEVAGYKGRVSAARIDMTGFAGLGTSEIPATSVGYHTVERTRKVAYVELYEDRDRAGIAATRDIRDVELTPAETNNEGINVVRFRNSFAAKAGWLPVFFLPWEIAGAIVRLRIPAKGTTNPDPDIFLTAAINGCSIFVQGTADNPTIYHAGGRTGQSDHDESARFWREALRSHIRKSRTAQGRGQVTAEVNKTHYVKTMGTTGDASTPRAENYEAWLKQKLDKNGKFTVTMVNPWGCVMGIRTGTDWRFYLQENATVICNIVTKQGVQTRMYARPMTLRQIYPGGGAVTNMSMKVPVKIQ